MINFELGDFRIKNIAKVTDEGFGELSEKDGLAIERRTARKDGWFVICFIKYDVDDYKIEDCDHRIVGVDQTQWQLIRQAIELAGEIVCMANEVEKSEIEKESFR